jgi:hypothetical protein
MMDCSQSERKFDKQFVPGGEQWYVEFCEFDRPGRDEYNRDRLVGGRELVDTLLRCGISDFLLPGKDGSQVKHTGSPWDFEAVWNGIGEEFEGWLMEHIARLNRLRRPDGTLVIPEAGDDLGNLPSSASLPSTPSAEPAPAAPEYGSLASAP